MKKIQFILFSFLLILGLFLVPNKVLANSLQVNQVTSLENSSIISGENLSLKNKIAQHEGDMLRANYCFEAGTPKSPIKILITNVENGISVTAYAHAYTEFDNLGVKRQHLAIYRPTSNPKRPFVIYHYPLNSQKGPICSMPFSVVGTDIESVGTKAIHLWNNPRAVLTRGEVSTVQCNSTPVAEDHCEGKEWYWNLP